MSYYSWGEWGFSFEHFALIDLVLYAHLLTIFTIFHFVLIIPQYVTERGPDDEEEEEGEEGEEGEAAKDKEGEKMRRKFGN